MVSRGRLERGGVCSDEVECLVVRCGVLRCSELWGGDVRGGDVGVNRKEDRRNR